MDYEAVGQPVLRNCSRVPDRNPRTTVFIQVTAPGGGGWWRGGGGGTGGRRGHVGGHTTQGVGIVGRDVHLSPYFHMPICVIPTSRASKAG